MYLAATIALFMAFFGALAGGGIGLSSLWQEKHTDLRYLEWSQRLISLCLVVSSAMLVSALAGCDFSLDYVASYTERALPLFYRLTAFWAGQAGSLLFWALMVSLCGTAFLCTRTYRELSLGTKLWFLTFFLCIMAFFALLLCTRNNPFTILPSVPADGQGLNPLLQNPGMIFHPPLLFLGYGGFVIPACLALAQAMNPGEEEQHWLDAARPFTLTGWLFLSAGIALGAWWAYMELGWGGYWAWDPVENASLIPWLIGTAALHTGITEQRRGKLHRTNIFLISLTTVSAFFATWLVRGNVVNSVHGYGEGNVGPLLFAFASAFFVVICIVALQAKGPRDRHLEGLETREGFVVMTVWLLIALSILILTATLWPVISRIWAERPVGLDAHFYNHVCLPLFCVMLALLSVCPWMKWQGGLRTWKGFLAICSTLLFSLGLLWAAGITKAMPLIAAALGICIVVGSVLLLAEKRIRSWLPSAMACLVHASVGIIALGIAFSGPYKQEVETELAPGKSIEIGPYVATLSQMYEGRGENYSFIEAELKLTRGGKDAGTVSAQRRLYDKFKRSAFSEAATCPSLGTEFYATLLGMNGQNAVLRMSANPGVNWLWIGATLMSLAPFLGLRRRGAKKDAEARA